jgi:hypothetical protein
MHFPVFLGTLRNLTRSSAAGLMILLAACSSGVAPAPSSVRTEAMWLLNNLSQKESEVGKILLIKDPDEDVAELTRSIASTFSDISQELNTLHNFKEESSPLPQAEQKTRESIQHSETFRLIGSDGKNFRVRFLISQASAVQYAIHLIDVLKPTLETAENRDRFSAYQKDLESYQTRIEKCLGAEKFIPERAKLDSKRDE